MINRGSSPDCIVARRAHPTGDSPGVSFMDVGAKPFHSFSFRLITKASAQRCRVGGGGDYLGRRLAAGRPSGRAALQLAEVRGGRVHSFGANAARVRFWTWGPPRVEGGNRRFGFGRVKRRRAFLGFGGW